MANAKAKGIRIGRLKTRDSDLIRKLRASGMTYRQIATIAKCSSGAVSAELRALKKEKIIDVLKKPEIEQKVNPISVTSSPVQSFQEIEFSPNEFKLELDLVS